MEEYKTVPISEVVGVCKQFIEGKINQSELEEWGKKITVKVYLSVQIKMRILSNIINYSNYIETTDCSWETVQIEEMKFWYGLLAYTNIQVLPAEEELYYTDDMYDLLYPIIGLWIEQYCENDYQALCKMLDNNFNIYWARNTMELFENLDSDSLTAAVQENKKMLDDIKSNEDTVNKLIEVGVYNDPYVKAVGDSLKKQVIEDIKKKPIKNKK